LVCFEFVFNFIFAYNSQRSWLLMCLYNYNYYFSSYNSFAHSAKFMMMVLANVVHNRPTPTSTVCRTG